MDNDVKENLILGASGFLTGYTTTKIVMAVTPKEGSPLKRNIIAGALALVTSLVSMTVFTAIGVLIFGGKKESPVAEKEEDIEALKKELENDIS